MSSMPTGRFIPGKSLLHRMNGTVKLLCFCVLIAAVILTDSVWGYALTAVFCLGIVKMSGICAKLTVYPVIHLWLFFVVIFLMNTMFFGGEHIFWSWWIFQISAEGMVQGANIVFRVILIMVLGNVLSAVTSPVVLTSSIETLIIPLRLIGVPTGDVAMIISVAVQFVPTFIEEADMIKKAQIARGARFESERLRDRAASVMPLVVPVFLSAFRRADELAMAMEARGYRRAKGRTRRKTAPLQPADGAAFAVSCILCAAQILL